jgi:hypothetical protein
MGLDTTHDAWHGAYSAFTRWRHAVAVAAGYRIVPGGIRTVDGRPEYVYDCVDLDWDVFEAKNYQGEWDRPPGDDPLLYLIVHSDCDGVIHPKEGRHLARRLEGLLPKLDDDEVYFRRGAPWSMRSLTEQFIAGLRKAADADEDVQFQ